MILNLMNFQSQCIIIDRFIFEYVKLSNKNLQLYFAYKCSPIARYWWCPWLPDRNVKTVTRILSLNIYNCLPLKPVSLNDYFGIPWFDIPDILDPVARPVCNRTKYTFILNTIRVMESIFGGLNLNFFKGLV